MSVYFEFPLLLRTWWTQMVSNQRIVNAKISWTHASTNLMGSLQNLAFCSNRIIKFIYSFPVLKKTSMKRESLPRNVFFWFKIFGNFRLSWLMKCIRAKSVSPYAKIMCVSGPCRPYRRYHMQLTHFTNPTMHMFLIQQGTIHTEMCTFLLWMVPYGIWNKCVMAFVKWVSWCFTHLIQRWADTMRQANRMPRLILHWQPHSHQVRAVLQSAGTHYTHENTHVGVRLAAKHWPLRMAINYG